MKKIISLILATLCITATLCSCSKKSTDATATTAVETTKAEETVYTDRDFNYVKLADGTAKIISYNKAESDGDITVPATLGGLNVTVIGSNAFTDAQKVLKVRLPRHLTKVESYAFNKSSVTSVLFHQTKDDTKLTVESNAFNECDSLNQVIFSNAVSRIEASAFHLGKTPRQITFTVDPEYIDNNMLDTGESQDIIKNIRLCHRGDISNYKNLKAFADIYGIEPILGNTNNQ